MEDNYVYVFVTQKASGLEISLFKDLDAAKESKREDDGVFTGWVEKYGEIYLYCLHSPVDEEWYIFKRKVN